MKRIIDFFLRKINISDQRSKRQFKNIFYVFIAKGLYAALSLLILPILIHQVDTYQFGVFTTIVTVTTWFTLIDGGLANGMKGKLSEALAMGNLPEAKKIVSTSYIVLGGVVLFFAGCIIIMTSFFDWNFLFKVTNIDGSIINRLMLIGSIAFLTRVMLDLISVILYADQSSSGVAFMQLAMQCLVFIWFLVLKHVFHSTDLIMYACGYFIIPVLVLIIVSFVLFKGRYKHIRPSFLSFDFKNQKKLFSLSWYFFLIQIAGIIVFTTDTLIIGRIFDYSEVAKYNVAYRYFGICTYLHSIIITPYWTAFSESYVKKDYSWIKKTIKQLLFIWGGVVIIAFCMLLVAQAVYKIWIGKDIDIPPALNISMFLFIVISCWNNVFAYFLNGVGKIKLQLYNALLVGIINIPVSILLATKFSFGSAGVILGTSVCLIISAIWSPIQYLKIINNRASGIWNK